MHESDGTWEPSSDDAVEIQRLFDAARGCVGFDQRILRFRKDEMSTRLQAEADEILYVLEGTGEAAFHGEEFTIGPGTAAFVSRGAAWQVMRSDGLAVLSVLVHDGLPGDGTTHTVIDIADSELGGATAGRHFQLLATPEVGCLSATQFVGHIPVGRAPDHFHTYDEVVYVLEGTGALHIGGETAPLRSGSVVHLPARLVHSLENAGPGGMQVLGVFRPAGSPAEAYYPDGTLAAVPSSETEDAA